MSASDPLIEASVAGLDLVPIEMAITAAGTAIDTPPIAGVIQSQSVILYCKRHSNIERLIARVRSEFANVATRATLTDLLSAVLDSATLFGVTILTESEVYILATKTVAQMETELNRLQSAGGLPALNRSVQSDAAVAEAGIPGWQKVILSCLDPCGNGPGLDWFAMLRRVDAATVTASLVMIENQWLTILSQLAAYILGCVMLGEKLTTTLLCHLHARMLRRRTQTAKRAAHRTCGTRPTAQAARTRSDICTPPQ
jgi:hypothetical protein